MNEEDFRVVLEKLNVATGAQLEMIIIKINEIKRWRKDKRERTQLDDGDKEKLQIIIKELAPKLKDSRKEGERLTIGIAERLLHAMSFSLLKEQTKITKASYARVMRCGKPDALRTRLKKAESNKDIFKYRGALRKRMIEEGIIYRNK